MSSNSVVFRAEFDCACVDRRGSMTAVRTRMLEVSTTILLVSTIILGVSTISQHYNTASLMAACSLMAGARVWTGAPADGSWTNPEP